MAHNLLYLVSIENRQPVVCSGLTPGACSPHRLAFSIMLLN